MEVEVEDGKGRGKMKDSWLKGGNEDGWEKSHISHPSRKDGDKGGSRRRRKGG